MNQDTHDKIINYLRTQLSQADARLASYTVDINNKAHPRRSAALVLDKYVGDFKNGKDNPRWIVVSGLRGVGKTTMLAQLYSNLQCGTNCKLYISMDEATRVLGVGLDEVLTVYEELLGQTYEELKEEIFIFIDEIHYEKNWALILKALYDKSKKVFIFCTGSSALSLNDNPDVSRRALFERLYPMSFTEYQLLKSDKFPIRGLGNEIKDALFNSQSGDEVYTKLLALKPKVQRYFTNINRLELDRYLKYGTLPFTLQYGDNEHLIYQQIEQTLTNIVNKDVPLVGRLDTDTNARLMQILYTLSSTDVTSLNTYANTFQVNVKTMSEVLSVFEKSEVLLRVFPYGSHFGQIKKPSKYLFQSPGYRSMFHNVIGSNVTYENYKGRLMEDIVGMCLNRMFGRKFAQSLTYDSAEGGADFIITQNDKIIAIEVGYGSKGFRQVNNTLDTVKGIYGLSISSGVLKISNDRRSVGVPISYFLLI